MRLSKKKLYLGGNKDSTAAIPPQYGYAIAEKKENRTAREVRLPFTAAGWRAC